MSVTGVHNARVISGYLVRSRVSLGGGHLAFQANGRCARPSCKSLQTLNAKKNGAVETTVKVG